MVTPAYQDITCGQSVLGTFWADTSIRDTDWYRFTVTSSTTATWTASGELPFAIALLDISNCSAPAVLSNGGTITTASGCATATASAVLSPGTYVAFVAPNDYNYYVCSGGLYNQYWATLTMTTTTPSVTPDGVTTFCQGGDVVLTSSSTTNNTWTPGGATTQAITVTTSGSYTVTVPDPNGCGPQTSSSVTVTVNSVPTTPTISGTASFCTGGSTTLTSSSATGNVWSPGGATTQSIPVSNATDYTVTVTANGCSATSAATTVTENPLPATPTINASGPLTFCDPGSVTLTSSSATGNVWSPGGATTQAITVDADGSYTVTVTDGNGCVSAASAATVVDEEICIGVNETALVNSLNIFPNPASDVLNIEFTVDEVNFLEVRVMNAMGQLVYQDIENAFSGTYRNSFSVNGLATGSYMLQVVTDKAIVNKKVMVK
jgi:predicted RNase H-like HicB family nuclease